VIDVQFYENAVAGLYISGSNNFTFEATFDGSRADDDFAGVDSSAGSVGSADGQQPIEIIIEDSSLLTFTDMGVQSINGEWSDCFSIETALTCCSSSLLFPEVAAPSRVEFAQHPARLASQKIIQTQ